MRPETIGFNTEKNIFITGVMAPLQIRRQPVLELLQGASHCRDSSQGKSAIAAKVVILCVVRPAMICIFLIQPLVNLLLDACSQRRWLWRVAWNPWRADIVVAPLAPPQQLVGKHKRIELVDQQVFVCRKALVKLIGEHEPVVPVYAFKVVIRETLAMKLRVSGDQLL